jgi:hypothetical protein
MKTKTYAEIERDVDARIERLLALTPSSGGITLDRFPYYPWCGYGIDYHERWEAALSKRAAEFEWGIGHAEYLADLEAPPTGLDVFTGKPWTEEYFAQCTKLHKFWLKIRTRILHNLGHIEYDLRTARRRLDELRSDPDWDKKERANQRAAYWTEQASKRQTFRDVTEMKWSRDSLYMLRWYLSWPIDHPDVHEWLRQVRVHQPDLYAEAVATKEPQPWD